MSPGLESIVIENFQSLRGPVELPLRPITLLYGPNSSGKSAVFDALHLLQTLLRGDEKELHALLNRWSHQDPERGGQSAISLRVSTLSRMAGSLGDADVALSRLPGYFLSAPESITFEKRGLSRLSFAVSWPVHNQSHFGDDVSIGVDVDGERVLQVRERDGEQPEATFQLFQGPFGDALRALADEHDVDADHPSAFKCDCFVVNDERLRLTPAFVDEDWRHYEATLFSVANWLLLRVSELLLAPRLVVADRGVIPNSTLAIQAHVSTTDPYIGSSYKAALGLPKGFASIPMKGWSGDGVRHENSVMQQLMLSFLGQRHVDVISELHASRRSAAKADEADREDDDAVPNLVSPYQRIVSAFDAELSGIYSGADEPLHVFANRCLSEHLFIDQAYSVHFDACEILPAEGAPAAGTCWGDRWRSDTTYRFPIGLAALVFCSLRDKKGRRVTFEDVGTGISCVLPVIASLHSGFAFIQQPELHLHPVLQSALADVVIETANRGSTLHILETHSEHLLLRCLRRMRETSSGRQPANNPQRLTPDKIAVLYFDPQADGSTAVKHIRLTADGEFIDRWPRGFFEERARDLFDE